MRVAKRLASSILYGAKRPLSGSLGNGKSRPTLTLSHNIEEEEVPCYKPTNFYPVRIGEVLGERYRVIGKLGFGVYSTVWLCNDLRSRQYVTVKVSQLDSAQASRERSNYQKIDVAASGHNGARFVRTLLDDFEIRTSSGTHICLVHETLGIRFYDFQKALPSRQVPQALLRPLLTHVLLALDFLHSEANLIHTDIQAKNVLLRISDDKLLSAFEQTEADDPTPVKIDGDRHIYLSRSLPITGSRGPPVLCDFGEARQADQSHDELIQPAPYRAPEVLFGIPWNRKVDIWNVGVMAWHLAQGKFLFNAQDENRKNSAEHHVAEMIALLGNPPRQLLPQQAAQSGLFDDDGNWTGSAHIPDLSFAELSEQFEGNERALFIQFIKKMIRWLPEERCSASELLKDPWLQNR